MSEVLVERIGRTSVVTINRPEARNALTRGVLLAVPLGAVVKILVQRAVKAYLASEYYSRPADAGRPGAP